VTVREQASEIEYFRARIPVLEAEIQRLEVENALLVLSRKHE
jgi:uncharacterized small protein (DUF1192 family)